MKVAYLLPEIACISGNTNGIKMQAQIWADGLRRLGVSVTLLGPWDEYKFEDCDIVHFFSYYAGMELDIERLKRKFGGKVAVSPIIDTNRPAILTHIASYCHCSKLHMYSHSGSMRRCRTIVDRWFVRSDYEGCYLHKAFGIEKISKVMLPARMSSFESNKQRQRKNFCLHVAFLPDERKNTFRLIEAAIKYQFPLILAGRKSDERQYERLLSQIAGHDNIKVLGWVSEDELRQLYEEARVFVLPSLYEGVGLVALEAAACGCDIVLTERGAPKEYYNGMAYLVNPLSVDEIGQACRAFLMGRTNQPLLQEYIIKNHSVSASSLELYKAYGIMLASR